jgi:peptide/nickel transport system substrate-binding protein
MHRKHSCNPEVIIYFSDVPVRLSMIDVHPGGPQDWGHIAPRLGKVFGLPARADEVLPVIAHPWRRSALVTAVAAATVAALAACSSTAPAEGSAEGSAEPQTLTLAVPVDIESFDPAVLPSVGDYPLVWTPVYDTLLRQEPDGTLVANLATAWEYNEDSTALTLELRDDVTFTDGEAFDADAVKANLEHFIAGTGVGRYTADAIESVDVVDEHEVTINLSAPDPSLTTSLAFALGAMASPAALEGDGIALEPVGSGPYTLDVEQTVKGTQYVYTRNTDYWDAESFPYDDLVIKVLADANARLNAMISGQIDAGRITIPLQAQAESQGLTTYNNPVDWVGLAILDRDGSMVPALADVRVRQAMNMVFDREGMLSALAEGQGTVTEQIVGQQSTAYDESLNDTYGYDVEQAKKLMAEAGYADGFDLPMIDRERYTQYAPYVEQALGQIGITVKWNTLAEDVATSATFAGEYPVVIISEAAPVDSWTALNVAYENTWNVFDTKDDEFTALMEAARTAPADQADTAFQEANAWLVDNAWFAPWFYVDLIYATSADVDVTVQAGLAGPQLRSFVPAE